MNNFARIENGTQWLKVLCPGDLPEIDHQVCFKTIQILEGFPFHQALSFDKFDWCIVLVEASICVPKVKDETDALEAEYVENVIKAVSLYGDAVFVGEFHFGSLLFNIL